MGDKWEMSGRSVRRMGRVAEAKKGGTCRKWEGSRWFRRRVGVYRERAIGTAYILKSDIFRHFH